MITVINHFSQRELLIFLLWYNTLHKLYKRSYIVSLCIMFVRGHVGIVMAPFCQQQDFWLAHEAKSRGVLATSSVPVNIDSSTAGFTVSLRGVVLSSAGAGWPDDCRLCRFDFQLSFGVITKGCFDFFSYLLSVLWRHWRCVRSFFFWLDAVADDRHFILFSTVQMLLLLLLCQLLQLFVTDVILLRWCLSH